MKISEVVHISPRAQRTPRTKVVIATAQVLNLIAGQTVDFTITGDVQPLNKGHWYIPVTSKLGQANYGLTPTSLTLLSTKLGDDTANWNGARFTSFVSIKRNPQSNGQTVGFDIMADSVRTPSTKR